MSLHEIKLCIFLPSLERGGAERRMTLLAVELKKKGYILDVVVLRQKGQFEAFLHEAGVAIQSVEKAGRFDLLGAAKRTRQIFAKNRYNIVLSCLPSANMFASLSKLVDKKTQLIWGLAAADMPMSEYGLWDRIGAVGQRYLSRYADSIVVNSHKAKQVAIQQGYRQDRIRVIQNGVDTHKFQPNAALRKQWRVEHDIPENANLIGIVARLDPAKGLETFIQAVDLAKDKKWYFLVIGSGSSEYAKRLKKRIETNDLYQKRLFLLENIQVDSAVYNAMDILSITSVSESFPNVMLESMASGTKLVSTDVGDCRAVIDQYGKVIAVNDVQALYEVWQSELRDNDRQSKGFQEVDSQEELSQQAETANNQQKMREYIISKFSIECMVDKFEQAVLDQYDMNVDKDISKTKIS